jgi:hypothetical protein
MEQTIMEGTLNATSYLPVKLILLGRCGPENV